MNALHRLAQTIESRKTADPGSSWTAKLLAKGPENAPKNSVRKPSRRSSRQLRATVTG